MARASKKQKSRSKVSLKRATNHRKITHHARRIKSVARRHYYTYMPNKKHHRVLVWVVFLLLAGQYAIQMLYPLDRALPLARIGDQPVGWQKDPDLAKTLSDHYARSKVSLFVDNKTSATVSLPQLGAEPAVGRQVVYLENYPFWQRLVPFSLWLQWPSIKTVQVEFASSVLPGVSESIAKKLSHAPQNARLAIKDGALVAVDDVLGTKVVAADIERTIRDGRLLLGKTTRLKVPAQRWPAQTTIADFSVVRSQAEAALARTLRLEIADKTFRPTRMHVASWLVIGERAGQPTLTLDSKKVAGYLDGLNKAVGRPAGQTNINLENGREINRQTGAIGKAIDQPPLIDAIRQRLLGPADPSPIQGQLIDLQPSVIYNNKYTSSEAGLRAYVRDAARDQNANIVVRQLDGQQWSASDSAEVSIPSASTYKLFVAKILFDKMNRGETSWDDPILDTTVDTCFDRMTIASTNPCAQEWLRRWGRDYVNQSIWKLGFSRGTTFTAPDAVHTTAGDLANFMTQLENGSIIGGAQRERLLRSLSTHPYRYGVPTGSQGQVWNKVGFLWDYVHDAAIVHHPKGRYVIVVMTKGRSYGTIAAITRQVERIMYP